MVRKKSESSTADVATRKDRNTLGYGDDFFIDESEAKKGRADDEVVINIPGKPKPEPFPRIYVVIDKKDNAPVGPAHLKERDAYEERRAFAEAGVTTDVVIYEPLIGGRR